MQSITSVGNFVFVAKSSGVAELKGSYLVQVYHGYNALKKPVSPKATSEKKPIVTLIAIDASFENCLPIPIFSHTKAVITLAADAGATSPGEKYNQLPIDCVTRL